MTTTTITLIICAAVLFVVAGTMGPPVVRLIRMMTAK